MWRWLKARPVDLARCRYCGEVCYEQFSTGAVCWSTLLCWHKIRDIWSNGSIPFGHSGREGGGTHDLTYCRYIPVDLASLHSRDGARRVLIGSGSQSNKKQARRTMICLVTRKNSELRSAKIAGLEAYQSSRKWMAAFDKLRLLTSPPLETVTGSDVLHGRLTFQQHVA